MSIESLGLHNPALLKDIQDLAYVYDVTNRKTLPIVLYKSKFKEAEKYGVLHFGEHPIIEGPATRQRKRRPPDAALF